MLRRLLLALLFTFTFTLIPANVNAVWYIYQGSASPFPSANTPEGVCAQYATYYTPCGGDISCVSYPYGVCGATTAWISRVAICPEGQLYTPGTSAHWEDGTYVLANCSLSCPPDLPYALTSAQGDYCSATPPCTAGTEVEGYAPTTNTQIYNNCKYEPKDGAQQKTIYSGVYTGTHTTWVNTGESAVGDNSLIIPGSPETPCEGFDCCLDMTEGQGYEGELAFLYCEEFWTEENKSTESYYKY